MVPGAVEAPTADAIRAAMPSPPIYRGPLQRQPGRGRQCHVYTTASVDAIVPAHPEVDWEQLRMVEKGWRSPLASLRPQPAPVPV
ncbi:hypothetical protein ACF1CG_36110 [Streptomyces sp. NPDC014773]|uniref:hypothetical protein n=1 Tax=Streptomyces sp. NPDC014773 TaxID=3364908 RepID=UPI0036FC5782